MSPIKYPRLIKPCIYSSLFLLFLFFFLALSHTVLRRSLQGAEKVFDDGSCFDSHDSDISEVIGAEEKESKEMELPQMSEEKRRLARIESHPFASTLKEIEEARGMPLFSIPRNNRISLDEAVQIYEERMGNLRCAPKQREENILYALKQQATQGDNCTVRPWLFNYKSYLDWRAWNSLKGRDREFCKRKYVKFMKLLIFKYGLKPPKK